VGLREGGGFQYQNMLDLGLTTRILDLVWPVNAVFSGDDHDYCECLHEVEGRRETFTEYTVKSFSWAMVFNPLSPPPSAFNSVLVLTRFQGIKYPGYQLLSLHDDGGAGLNAIKLPPAKQAELKKLTDTTNKDSQVPTTAAASWQGTKHQKRDIPHFATKPCTLPSPIDIFKLYGLLAVISLGCIIWSHRRPAAEVEYFELADVAKDEENGTNGHGILVGEGSAGRRGRGCFAGGGGWRRGDILGILRDCVSLYLFVGVGFFLQILGVW
jgi:hypothetical protein